MHIDGEKNYWADLLSRWGASESLPLPSRARMSTLLLAPIAPELYPDLIWPKMKDVQNEQKEAAQNGEATPPDRRRGFYVGSDSVVWIPSPGSL